MKKFLATLLVIGSLLFASTVDAAIEKYIGTGTAIANEDETQDTVIKRATTYAFRNAREQIGSYVKNFAQTKAVDLSEEDVETLSVGILKFIDTNVEKNFVDNNLQVRVTVTVEIDSDDLQREIDKISQNKPVATETVKIYSGEAATTVFGSETNDQTVKRAEAYALKDIRYQINLDIRTFARTRKLELTNPEVDFVAEKVVKITDKTVEQSLLKDTIQVRVKLTAQIDDADLARCIEEVSRRRNS